MISPKYPFIITILALSWMLGISVQAQHTERIAISVLLNESARMFFKESAFDDFKQAHPHVDIHLIYDSQQILRPAHGDVETYLDEMEQFTQKADILLLSVGGIGSLSPEATRAGYILDLAPLFNASPTADANHYYPATWQAAQWDHGLWMLPASATVSATFYHPASFDAVGLSYPTADWTPQHVIHAADLLAERDSAGNVIRPGFYGMNISEGTLFAQTLTTLETDRVIDPPDLLQSGLVDIFNQWSPAWNSGAIFRFGYAYEHSFQLYQSLIPLWIRPLWDYTNETEADLVIAPLTQVEVSGFGISSYTQHPEIAYQLIEYMAGHPEIITGTLAGTSYARPELNNIEPLYRGQSAEYFPVIEQALRRDVSTSELFYPFYIYEQFMVTTNEGGHIEQGLQALQSRIINDLAFADANPSQHLGTIASPESETVLASHEVELHFYYPDGATHLWEAFVEDFVLHDPQVGRVVLRNPVLGLNYGDGGVDCFYTGSPIIRDAQPYLLDIAPLLASDPTIHPEDWLPNVFDALRDGERIYAVPISVRPLALWYDRDAVGIFPPQTTHQLFEMLQTDDLQLTSSRLGTSLLMFLASEGIFPVTMRDGLYHADFTSLDHLAGIQYILDLARAGKINYSGIEALTVSPYSEPFIIDYVQDNDLRGENYLPLTFPAGNSHVPIHYQVYGGFINRSTQHPEACYRLLREIAGRSELINGLPAQHMAGEFVDYPEFYETFRQQLTAPDAVTISGANTTFDYHAYHGLFQAFDRYVLDGADLFSVLQTAERFASDYLQCTVDDTPTACAQRIDLDFE